MSIAMDPFVVKVEEPEQEELDHSVDYGISTKVSLPSECYRCPECFEGFFNLMELNDHIKIHSSGQYPSKGTILPSCTLTPIQITNLAIASSSRGHAGTAHMGQQSASKNQNGLGTGTRETINILQYSDSLSEREGHTSVFPSYRCRTCSSSFTSAMDLWDHQRTHDVQSDFFCNICGKSYNNRTALRKHQYLHQDERKFACLECGMRFNSNGNLKRHKRTHTGERPYSCEVCQKSFAQVTTLKNHMTTHTNDRPYVCEVCNKRFPRKGHLTGHMGTHINFNDGPVNVYLKSVNVENRLKTEIDVNLDNRSEISNPVDCTDGKRYTLESNFTLEGSSRQAMQNEVVVEVVSNTASEQVLKVDRSETQWPGDVHVPSGSVIEPTDQVGLNDPVVTSAARDAGSYADIGTKSDKGKSMVNNALHEKNTKSDSKHDGNPVAHRSINVYRRPFEESRFATADINKTRSNSNDATVVVGTIFTGSGIVNVKHFRCNICGKILTSSNHLKEHKLIHTGGKPHHCQFCKKSFRNSGNLRRHERTHTGVRPYKCKLCSKSFTQAGTLKNHMFTHTKLRPFLCYECGEGFTRNRNLKDHVRAVHAKERPFACPFCTHRTFRQDRLNKHIDVIHGGRKGYICDICGRYFKTVKTLKIHKQKHSAADFAHAAGSKPQLNKVWQIKKQAKQARFVCNDCNIAFHSQYYLRAHRSFDRSVKASKCKNRELHNVVPYVVGDDAEVADQGGKLESNKERNLERKVAVLKVKIGDAATITSMNTSYCKDCYRTCTPSGCFASFGQCHRCLKLFPCDLCKKEFFGPFLLKQHYGMCHSKRSNRHAYTCTLCNRMFANPNIYIAHRQFHFERYNVRSLNHYKGIAHHFLYKKIYRPTWGLIRRFLCSICSKSFAFLGKLKQHEKGHRDGGEKEPVQDSKTCRICHQSFQHSGALFSHMKTHASNKNTKFKCKDCKKSFSRLVHLKEHLLTHAEKQFRCTVCNETFDSAQVLQKHKEKHEKLTCDFCDQIFHDISEREKHAKEHQVIGMQYIKIESKAEMEVGSASHETDEMLYLCQVCGGGFHNIEVLEIHQRGHCS